MGLLFFPRDELPVTGSATRAVRWPVTEIAWWAVFLSVVVAILFPLTLTVLPPLADYPQHLARAYLLGFGADDPILSAMWGQQWGIIPNIVIDLLLPPLMHVVPIYTAGKLVIGLTLLLPFVGVIAYSRAALGTWSFWPLASALVLYNTAFAFGFLNFQMSIGIALLLAAFWIRTRERRPILGMIVCLFGAIGIFFCHMFGLLFFALLIGARELTAIWGVGGSAGNIAREALWRGGAVCLVFLGPGLLFLVSPLAEEPFKWSWPGWAWKLEFLFSPFLAYQRLPDVFTGGVVLLTITACIVLRHAKVEAATVISGLMLITVYLCMPAGLMGTSYVDLRLPVMGGFLLFCGFMPQELPRFAAISVCVVLGLLFAGRMWGIADVWHAREADVAELRPALAAIEPGSRILPAWDPTPRPVHPSRLMATRIGHTGWLPAIAVLERRAFFPLLFTVAAKQPLTVLPPYRSISRAEGGAPKTDELTLPSLSADLVDRYPFLPNWQRNFDYLWVQEPARDMRGFLPDRMTFILQNDMVALLKIRR